MDTQKSVLLIVAVLVAGLFTGYAFLGKSTLTGEPVRYFEGPGSGGGLTCACGSTSSVYSGCKRLKDGWIDCGFGPIGCYEGWKCW